jgi:hypothetical protein
LGALKNSTAFKSFEQGVGSAYTTVKAKIAASTSIDHLYGHTAEGETNADNTSPPSTPSSDKPQPL